MSSGLYALPGASATATAAAWANRFDEPITKVSKMYFGLSRVSRAVPRVGAAPNACWVLVGDGRGQLRRPGPGWPRSPSSSTSLSRSALTSGGAQVGVDRDGQSDRLTERAAEAVLDPRAEPGLELATGEIVGDGDDRGVLMQRDRLRGGRPRPDDWRGDPRPVGSMP